MGTQGQECKVGAGYRWEAMPGHGDGWGGGCEEPLKGDGGVQVLMPGVLGCKLQKQTPRKSVLGQRNNVSFVCFWTIRHLL